MKKKNQKEIDRTFFENQQKRLEEFETWLFNGMISPQQAQEVIDKYYTEMPF